MPAYPGRPTGAAADDEVRAAGLPIGAKARVRETLKLLVSAYPHGL